ncbi:uncharacterized protein N7482_008430 [Penicillium canariense]|uniref:GPI anchored serine-rich protein n=1 Tax=Penicillium canariense TaxID=189055 RepID=A0A9W9LJ00_9EURO|nr:uncharacterized protein N7482_008430 [Penicillium canariense]KAJ5157330.1 hypothetical protein N7482_008430 [Penicillium canariense]
MRFTAVTIAFLAGLAAALPGAESTVTEVEEVTITSCAPTVTDCPARQTGVGATGSPAPIMTTAPGGAMPSGSWSSAPAPIPSSVAPVPAGPSVTVVPVVHTTCAAVTSWSTVVVPTASSPVGGTGGVPHVPSSVPVASGTASATPSATPAFNGAGALSGSVGFAGLAAAAAFFLA